MAAPRVELARQDWVQRRPQHQKSEDPRYVSGPTGSACWLGGNAQPTASPRIGAAAGQRVQAAIEPTSAIRASFAWWPFNEYVGVPDLPQPAATQLVRAMYHLTRRSTDPPVMATTAGRSWHRHHRHPRLRRSSEPRIAKRYGGGRESIQLRLAHERPGYRNLLLDGSPTRDNPSC